MNGEVGLPNVLNTGWAKDKDKRVRIKTIKSIITFPVSLLV